MKKKKNEHTARLNSKLPALRAQGYLRKEISPFVDLSPRTIQYYTDAGLVKPEIDSSRGKGSKRRYSVRNMFEFLLIKKLMDFGIPLAKMKSIVEDASNQWLQMKDAQIFILFTAKGESGSVKHRVQLRRELKFDVTVEMVKYSSMIVTNISDITSRL